MTLSNILDITMVHKLSVFKILKFNYCGINLIPGCQYLWVSKILLVRGYVIGHAIVIMIMEIKKR
jgi:hypothetical protein